MVNQVDATYFANPPVQVSGLTDLGTGVPAELQSANVAKLNYAIALYQKQYLKYLLGETLYTAFETGIAVTPTPEAKWTNLLNKIVDSANKISPIANYVFYNAVRDWMPVYSGIGASDNKADNANPISVVPLQVNAWNVMVDMNKEIVSWLEDNRSIYEVDTVEYPSPVEWWMTGLFEYENRFGI